MFAQRYNNSFDLVGTNARNSDCSFGSAVNNFNDYFIGRLSVEKTEIGNRNSNIDSLFAVPQNLRPSFTKQGSQHEDYVEQLLNTRSFLQPNMIQGITSDRNSAMSGNIFINHCENPFSF